MPNTHSSTNVVTNDEEAAKVFASFVFAGATVEELEAAVAPDAGRGVACGSTVRHRGSQCGSSCSRSCTGRSVVGAHGGAVSRIIAVAITTADPIDLYLSGGQVGGLPSTDGVQPARIAATLK